MKTKVLMAYIENQYPSLERTFDKDLKKFDQNELDVTALVLKDFYQDFSLFSFKTVKFEILASRAPKEKFSLALLLEFIRIIKKHRPDVIHLYGKTGLYSLSVALKAYPLIGFFVTLYEGKLPNITSLFRKMILSRVDQFFVPTQGVQYTLTYQHSIKAKKISVVDESAEQLKKKIGDCHTASNNSIHNVFIFIELDYSHIANELEYVLRAIQVLADNKNIHVTINFSYSLKKMELENEIQTLINTYSPCFNIQINENALLNKMPMAQGIYISLQGDRYWDDVFFHAVANRCYSLLPQGTIYAGIPPFLRSKLIFFRPKDMRSLINGMKRIFHLSKKEMETEFRDLSDELSRYVDSRQTYKDIIFNNYYQAVAKRKRFFKNS